MKRGLLLAFGLLLGCTLSAPTPPTVAESFDPIPALPRSIPVANSTPAWDRMDRVTVLLRPAESGREPIVRSSMYQTVLRDGDDYLVTFERPDDGQARQADQREVAAALVATASIQSDHPEIRRRAEQLAVGVRGDPAGLARHLAAWVQGHMRGEPAHLRTASALETLRTGRGDCTEHAYLLCALARACRIPARAAMGMVYRDRKLIFHTWSELCLGGRWVPFDTTREPVWIHAPWYLLLGHEYGHDREDAPYLDAIIQMSALRRVDVVAAEAADRRLAPDRSQ